MKRTSFILISKIAGLIEFLHQIPSEKAALLATGIERLELWIRGLSLHRKEGEGADIGITLEQIRGSETSEKIVLNLIGDKIRLLLQYLSDSSEKDLNRGELREFQEMIDQKLGMI